MCEREIRYRVVKKEKDRKYKISGEEETLGDREESENRWSL